MSDQPISALLFGTLLIGLVIAVALYLSFMRKRKNRHPMDGDRERNIGEIRAESTVERDQS